MLYDILSPLIFFFSLGGILIILGRVVIRMRRDQFTTSIKAAGSESQAAVLTAPSSEVASLLRPDNKSVHMVRTRMAFFGYMFRQSKATVMSRVAQRRERRAEKRAAAQAVVASTPIAEEAAPLETAATATTPGTLARAASKLRSVQAPQRLSLTRFTKRFRKTASEQSMPTLEAPAAVEQIIEEKTTAVISRKTIEIPRATTDAPAAITPTSPAPAVVAQPAERSFRRGLLRRSGTKQQEPSTLEKAEGALRESHYQQAEDVLVPYIVQHPKDTLAYMLLGRAAIGREAWGEAMEIFEQVVRWNDQQADGYALLGLSAYKAGKYTRALQALQRAHDANPADKQVLEYLLSIAQKMDNRGLQHSITEEIEHLSDVTENAERSSASVRARVR